MGDSLVYESQALEALLEAHTKHDDKNEERKVEEWLVLREDGERQDKTPEQEKKPEQEKQPDVEKNPAQESSSAVECDS